jgi:hypothetical protein
MRRRLGRLDGGGKSSWRRLGALLRTGVGGLTAAATSGLRFGIRVLRVRGPVEGLDTGCAASRECGLPRLLWCVARGLVVLRPGQRTILSWRLVGHPMAELFEGLPSMSAYVSKLLNSCSRYLHVSVACVYGF